MAEMAVTLPGGLTFEVLPTEETDEIKTHLRSLKRYKNLIRVKPPGLLLPDVYLNVANHIYNFKFQPSDVLEMSFPKSGSTWLDEIIWTMRHNPNLDNPRAQEKISDRCPYFELDTVDTMLMKVEHTLGDLPGSKCSGEDVPTVSYLRNVVGVEREKRQMKTHLPFPFFAPNLLKTCKVVSILRNPKDTIQSIYNFSRMFKLLDFCGDYETMVDIFIKDKYFFGSYWSFLREIWKKRGHPSFHILFYEDLVEDPEAEIGKLNVFLETSLSEEQITNIVRYTSFNKMKKRDDEAETPMIRHYFKDDLYEKEGGFFRKGRVGSWKKYPLSEEMEKKLAEWIEQNEDIGIKFRYE